MFVRFSPILFLSCFIFVEGKPLMSVSQDLNIIFSCNSTYPVDKRILNVALIERRFENVDEQFKCFLHCLYRAYNWMNSDGVFQFGEMRKTLVESTLDEPSIEYLVITCSEAEMKNKCEKAFSFTECFWTESEKLAVTFRKPSLSREDKRERKTFKALIKRFRVKEAKKESSEKTKNKN